MISIQYWAIGRMIASSFDWMRGICFGSMCSPWSLLFGILGLAPWGLDSSTVAHRLCRISTHDRSHTLLPNALYSSAPAFNDEKSQKEKNKNKRSKKKAYHGQSVLRRHRSLWKQSNIQMAISEDHASNWCSGVQKSSYRYQAQKTSCESGCDDSSKGIGRTGVMPRRLTDIERESWKGTQIDRPGSYGWQKI